MQHLMLVWRWWICALDVLLEKFDQNTGALLILYILNYVSGLLTGCIFVTCVDRESHWLKIDLSLQFGKEACIFYYLWSKKWKGYNSNIYIVVLSLLLSHNAFCCYVWSHLFESILLYFDVTKVRKDDLN